MFESHTNSDVIGLLFPSTFTADGRRLNSVLEDLYPELLRQGIDIIMVAGDPHYDSSDDSTDGSCKSYDSYGSYRWKYVYTDEPLYERIRSHYDVYNIPSLLWVGADGEILETAGKEMVFGLSNMYDNRYAARVIASKFFDDGYDSDL